MSTISNSSACRNRFDAFRDRVRIALCCALAGMFTLSVSRADEGMWTLDALQKLPLQQMRECGLTLTPEQIYSETKPSLKDAVVMITSGTASFVSPDGLLLTNHHVAFAGIQSLSSVESDYLKDGFHAKTRAEELSTSYTADVIAAMRDITAEVRAAVHDSMSSPDRLRAIRSKKLEIEEALPDTGGYGHAIVDMYGGARHYLLITRKLLDVRLVFAPPSAIGNFGGENDNWVWPRHTGDFTLMRAYVGPDGRPAPYSKENIPYKPTVFLPLSTRGIREGSFAMIMGFPGKTYRHYEASAVEHALSETLPTTIELYKARIDAIEEGTKRNRAVAIQYASKLRRIANAYKKSVGILEGMRRSNIITAKHADEHAFSVFAASSPLRAQRYGSLLGDLKRETEKLQNLARKNLVFNNLTSGVELLRIARRLTTYLQSLPEDSLGHPLPPTEREIAPMRAFLLTTFRDLDKSIDQGILTALLLKALALPAEHQLNLCREIADGAVGIDAQQRVRRFVDQLYRDTELASRESCERLLSDDREEIEDDPFVGFSRRLSEEEAPVERAVSQSNGRLAELRGQLMEGLFEWQGGDSLYPDANRTLRFTHGEVKSLSPRDAVTYSYVTSLTGMLEKETGQDPFVVPPQLKELWNRKDFGRYADSHLGDIPVSFITNLDITGGNSGSPVINGQGEVIGCAFDSNWEGVSGDYRYQERYARVISVDARYILFILDKFSGAQNILKELVIH